MRLLSKKALTWILFCGLTLVLSIYLGNQLLFTPHKKDFLIGETSHGHYQIELSCNACHVEPFGGTEILQNACLDCHEAELKASLDSHPKTKFTDPRNADLVNILDARYCVSCHVEHNPDVLHPMGVSLQPDFCSQCHQDIAENRPSHEGMGFETCASAGCHNYHDNTALYENFLLKHQSLDQPTPAQNPQKMLGDVFKHIGKTWQQIEKTKHTTHLIEQHTKPEIHQDWSMSAHAENGITCESCHINQGQVWEERPNHQVCATCHEFETSGFLSGKHGMRLAQNLPPMQVKDARLPMNVENSNQHLGCNSCHNPHTTNTQAASVESCLGCHADEHSQAFKESPHGKLWEASIQGDIPVNEAVSCASCHLPRVTQELHGEQFVRVEHNQNATLRPNEKMIRPSCMNCHSLAFSIDALADPALIKNNFSHAPATHIESIDMAVERDIAAQRKKGGEREN